MAKDKRRACSNLKFNQAKCPCPEDCPRRGTCCECIEFHAALGEVPYCVKQLVDCGAKTSAGSPAPKVAPGIVTLSPPGFKLTDFASCPG